jgi:hypothetical protein
VKHTAETVTDKQLRALLAAGGLTEKQVADCEHALRRRDRHWTRFERNMQRGARARCAEVLNERARACPGREHAAHVGDVCEGSCCTSCGGPIDENQECRC